MSEQKLADDLQRESNIDKIRRATAKVKAQREVENRDELDFDKLDYIGGDNE